MKFSSTIAFAAITGVVSADFNLRAAVGKIVTASDEPTNADVRVSIHGMKGDASAADMEIIYNSIKKAYNQAYETTGYSMDSFKAELSAPVPDKVSWDPTCRLCPPAEELGWDPTCRLCPPEVKAMFASSKAQGRMFLGQAKVSWDPTCRLCPPEADASVLGGIHAAFEQMFCSSLRQSGSSNLAYAHDCTFSFLDMPGQAGENLPIQSISEDKKTETQVTLHGTLHDFSEKDMEIIDEAILSAYNDAFASAGYSLGSLVSTADLDLPSKLSWDPTCRLCPPAAEKAKLVISTTTPLGWDPYFRPAAGSLGWDPTCRLCPPAEDAELSDAKLAFLQSAFEKTLCTKLQKSGSANFANVHNCSFRFVYAPVAEN